MGIPERREREKEHRREEILDAAEKVFFEKGLPQATMDEIAERAELSKGTLYLYYKSKEDLYLGVMCRGSAILYQMSEKATSTGEPTVKLIRNLGDAYYEFFKVHRNYFRMFYFFDSPGLQSHVSEQMMTECGICAQEIWNLITALIQKGIEDGTFRKGLDPLEMGVILWSNSNAVMRLMDRPDESRGIWSRLNLKNLLQKSNSMIVSAMLTEKAKQQYEIKP